MSEIIPAVKNAIIQRDREIFEYIRVFLKEGYSASAIYEKLSALTGLKPDYIRIVRFRLQKELEQQA
jgi:hypothetical protein